ncbi:MAG: site-specific integrase, partial [Candidatus Nanopelagicales bacterium]
MDQVVTECDAQIEAFLEFLGGARGRSPNTVRAYRNDLSTLFASMPDIESVAQLSLIDLRAWLPGLPRGGGGGGGGAGPTAR